MRSVLLLLLVGCSDGPATVGDPLDDPQLPARGTDDMNAWLTAGHYKSWHCEAEPHPARPNSGHSANRICNNDVLHADDGSEGPFVVGAAAVKELYDGDRIVGYAVYRKVTAGAGGASWYWYEAVGEDIIANGTDDDTCTGCHARAGRDFVFTRL
jgi:hypothetical protein